MKHATFRSRRQFLAAVALLLLTGCPSNVSQPPGGTASGGAADPDQPLVVTATVGMVADLVRRIGGEHVDVTQLCGSGTDPHLYKPTRDDVAAIRRADLVLYSGLKLEGKMGDVLARAGRSVAVAESLDPSVLIGAEAAEADGHADPHVWMDVSLWSEASRVIEKALSDAAPDHADDFAASADDLRDELERLHNYGKAVLASVPEDRRVLVTSHDAFSYFGRAYDLEVVGVQGISTESEAGLARINELVGMLVDRGVRSVFVESSVSKDNILALVEGAAARGHDVTVGDEELFSDAMGPDGTYEGTYVGMLDHNITLVARGLGGDVPEGGFRGWPTDNSEAVAADVAATP